MWGLPVQAFEVAIRLARRVFDQAAALGFAMRLLDLGGGLTAQAGLHEAPRESMQVGV
jgi:diaminopimelate decarboxylase